MEEERVPFTIVSKPSYIHLECPDCDEEIEIDWDNLKGSRNWEFNDEIIECPGCGKIFKLGDWEYD